MDDALKRCSTCGVTKPGTQFNVRQRAPDGRQSRCRDCCRAWYLTHKADHMAGVARRNKAYRVQTQERLAAHLAEHPCVDCGEDDISASSSTIGTAWTRLLPSRSCCSGDGSWRTIAKEIEKCDVRCANCHRRRTADQFSTWRHRLHEEETADLRQVALGRLRTVLAKATRGLPDGTGGRRVDDGPGP
jgi:hypothetical protein